MYIENTCLVMFLFGFKVVFLDTHSLLQLFFPAFRRTCPYMFFVNLYFLGLCENKNTRTWKIHGLFISQWKILWKKMAVTRGWNRYTSQISSIFIPFFKSSRLVRNASLKHSYVVIFYRFFDNLWLDEGKDFRFIIHLLVF